jgi:hypothetical protein
MLRPLSAQVPDFAGPKPNRDDGQDNPTIKSGDDHEVKALAGAEFDPQSPFNT